MKNQTKRSQWVGCSNFKERREELLKAHEEFLKMLADGYRITAAKKVRPRIKKEVRPRKIEVSILNGTFKAVLDFSEWEQHGSIGKVIRKIY